MSDLGIGVTVFAFNSLSMRDLELRTLVSYLLFLVEVGDEHDIANELKRFPGVTETQVVYGEYDVVARVELSDLALLDEIVTMARKLPGVTRTSTLISSGIIQHVDKS